jgi:hypothetical protein
VAEVKTLREVAVEMGRTYRSCWSAVHSGKLPGFQPFGPGTTWVVPANYMDILFKGGGATTTDENNI